MHSDTVLLFHKVTELVGRLRMLFIGVLLEQAVEIEEAEAGIVFLNLIILFCRHNILPNNSSL